MENHRQIIIYLADSDVSTAQAGVRTMVELKGADILSLDDFSAIMGCAALGLELRGTTIQIGEIEQALISAGHRIEDAGQAIRALDERRPPHEP